MANFTISNSSVSAQVSQQSMTTTYKTLLATAATSATTGPAIALKRGKLFDLLVGTNGTPGDQAMEYQVARTTVGSTFVYGGIVSSIGQQQLDPADSNMSSFAIVNSSAENFTITANSDQFYVAVNQRASYRWVAAPGSEIVWPATASAGLVGRAKSPTGYTGTATMQWIFLEQ